MKKSYFFIISGVLAIACVICLLVAVIPIANGSLDELSERHMERVLAELELEKAIDEAEEELRNTPYSDTNERKRLEELVEVREEMLELDQSYYGASYEYLKAYRSVSDRCRNMGIASAICGVGAIVVFVIGKKKTKEN